MSLLFTADIISTVEFNYSGDLLATGDKGGRVVIFQREQEVSDFENKGVNIALIFLSYQNVCYVIFLSQRVNVIIF